MINKPWKILVIDDDEGIHSITRMVFRGYEFENRSIQLINAMSATQAKTILEEQKDIAVTILDVVMETDDAGLNLVNYIRDQLNNTDLRIILRTGHPGFAPEAEVIIQYDINDYLSKAELSASRLLTSVVVALRSYRDIQSVKYLPSDNSSEALDPKHKIHSDQLLKEVSEKFNNTLQPLIKQNRKLRNFSHKPMIADLIKDIKNNCEKLAGQNSLLKPLNSGKKSTLDISQELDRITNNYISQAKTDDWIIDYNISCDFPEQLIIDSHWLGRLIVTMLEIALAKSNTSDLLINLTVEQHRLKIELNGDANTLVNNSHWLLMLETKLAAFCLFYKGKIELKKRGTLIGYSFEL